MKRFCEWERLVFFFFAMGLVDVRARGDNGVAVPDGEAGAIVVGSATDVFPHSFVDAAGSPQGFAVEVLDAAARAMNLRIRRVSLPNQMIQSGFLRGEYDMLECYGQSLVRAEKCDFSVPYNTLDGTIFVRSDAGDIQSLRDLEGKTFVLQGLGSIGEDFLEGSGLNCRKIFISASIDALRLISEGKADATIGARLTVMPLIDRHQIEGIRALDAPLAGFDIRHCFAVHKGDATLLAKLNEGLAIIHRTGEYERLYRRWFGRYEPKGFTREEVYRYAAATLLVGFVLATWAFWRQRRLDRRLARQSRELAAINKHLEQATRAKSEFIGTVSHELRNPIAGAHMMSEVLLKSALESATREQMEKLRGCIGYLQTVLDETLDLAQMDSGHERPRLASFRLGALLEESTAMFDSLARARGLGFQVETAGLGQSWFYGPGLHVRRILINYLGNALKFTPHGAVVLRAAQRWGKPGEAVIRFTVTDTGPGVPAELRPKLFSAFVRSGERAYSSVGRGAGLGLAVCKKLAELNGGQVGYVSVGGAGSAFWAELPLIAIAPPAEGESRPELPDFGQVRVLVVDDDASQREIASVMLQEFGVLPAQVGSARETREIFQTQCFDLVLMDYNLGEKTGIDLMADLRMSRGFDRSRTTFHLVTGHEVDGLMEQAREAGFASTQRKPLHLAALHGMLAEAERKICAVGGVN